MVESGKRHVGYDVDELELKVDAEIRSILARRTPVARDLRVVLACSKVVTDVEQIGDEACKLARIVVQIYEGNGTSPKRELLRDVEKTGRIVTALLRDAMHVLDCFDDDGAEELLVSYQELEEDFQSNVRRIATYMMEDSRNIGHAIRVVLALKSLERIGSHSKNIAEQIIFLVRGEDVRHRRDLRMEETAARESRPDVITTEQQGRVSPPPGG